MDKIKSLFRKLLRIHTLKLVLFNPASIRLSDDVSKYIPGSIFISCESINDIKIIDTGIPIKIKKENE